MQRDPKVKLARDLMPVTANCAYLNTGTLGPISHIYKETFDECLAEDLKNGRALGSRYEARDRAAERMRTEIAGLVGARPDEILLTQNTTDGIAAVLDGLQWQPGDEVISTQLEHEACSVPLQALADAGHIVLKIATVPSSGAEDISWLTDLMTSSTRLIAFSVTDFTSGQRLPFEEIAAAANEANVLTLLDGAQSVGAIPLDLGSLAVDFCAMPMQKWLCGPEGLGALFMRRGQALIPRKDRVTRGWPTFEATATHLESLRAQLGWDWIYERTLRLAAYAREQVIKIPNTNLLTPESHAGLVTLGLSAPHLARCLNSLSDLGLAVRYREDVPALRISTGFFNTEAEIDGFAAAVSELADS